MENERGNGASKGDCCGGGSDQPNGSTAGCACGGLPPRRSWLRTLIAGVVILAAVGVGAYSLMAKRPEKQAAPCGASVAPAAGKAAPAERSCCAGGGSAAKCAAQPAKGADSTACQRTCGTH